MAALALVYSYLTDKSSVESRLLFVESGLFAVHFRIDVFAV